MDIRYLGFPKIKRARAYRVYSDKGVRYLDMFQDAGRAILGHRPDALSQVIKSTVSKGLIASYPSFYEGRLIKALRSLLPGYNYFRIFSNKDDAVQYLKQIKGRAVRVYEPLSEASGDIAVWRPFSGLDYNDDVIMPVLPLPGSFAPAVLCFRNEPDKADSYFAAISPFLLSALCRLIYNLIDKIKSFNIDDYSDFPCPVWEKQGLYLVPKCTESEYPECFKFYLDNSVLISPEYKIPSIVPMEFTDGEIKILKKAF